MIFFNLDGKHYAAGVEFTDDPEKMKDRLESLAMSAYRILDKKIFRKEHWDVETEYENILEFEKYFKH